MGFKPKFTKADIEARLNAVSDRIEKAGIETLKYLGEQCVKIAREEGNYKDITGNLRNSIGYVIVAHGDIKWSNFKRSAQVKTTTAKGKTKTTKGSKNGLKAGKDLAEEIAKKFTSGYALIVVAGMSYAYYVETYHHRDVLNSADRYMDEVLPDINAQLKRNIGKMKL